jgi:hypothetical protein
MARIQESMHGAFRGKVGKLVGGKWNGIDYVRSLGVRTDKPASEAQLAQQIKMALTGNFVKSIKKIVKIGFRDAAVKMSGYNAAVQYVLNNAIAGTYPGFTLDYSRIMISRGQNKGAPASAVSSPAKETCTFTWNAKNIFGDLLKATDKSILLVYSEAFDTAVYTLEGPDRSTGTGSLELPGFSGQEIHTWLTFVSADRTVVFDSEYTGKVTVT